MTAPSRTQLPRSERGSAAVELVLLTPVLIALVFGLIQTALLWNARHTLGAAAQHGARQARTATALLPVGTATGGADRDAQIRASTLAFLQQIGGRSLGDPAITISRSGEFVTVTVSATSLGVLPGTTVRISSSSRTPVEGFRP